MLIGIDLGTSSVRVAVVDEAGRILGLGQEEYPIEAPRPGWAEQDPEAWWRATCLAARQAMSGSGVAAADIAGIGYSGQMHGTVLVDGSGGALGKAIIWADGRSDAVAKRLNQEIGDERLAALAGNRVSAGFMAATLAWMRDQSPTRLDGARWALLPKDYLRLRMGGPPASEPSDASATLLYDINLDHWSSELADAAGVDRSLLPPLARSHEVVGVLSARAAEEMSLRPGIPLVAGAGDQAAQAIGNGVLDSSMASCTIGTGGQILQPMDGPRTDPRLRVHCFRHARPNTWFLMAATLSAGLSLRWWRGAVGMPPEGGYEALDREAQDAGVGAEGLLFLPYLLGERTPHMDGSARAAFIGLGLGHGRGHLTRAVMEGVALSLRQGLDIMVGLTEAPRGLVASGGGAKSALWRQIQADVLRMPLSTVLGSERAVVGAAMLGGLGVGTYSTFEQAREACVAYGETIGPDPAACRAYDLVLETFESLYPALKPAYARLERVRAALEQTSQLSSEADLGS